MYSKLLFTHYLDGVFDSFIFTVVSYRVVLYLLETVPVSGIIVAQIGQVLGVRLLTLLSAWKTQLSAGFTPTVTYSSCYGFLYKQFG